MTRTVEDVLKDDRYADKFVTIRWMDFMEGFQPNERKNLLMFWGKEEVLSFFMENTRMLMINIT